jgi:hypothetical protein
MAVKKTRKPEILKLLIHIFCRQYTKSNGFDPPTKTAKWTLSRKSTTPTTKSCEVATSMNVFPLKNLNTDRQTLPRLTCTPGFIIFCWSARKSRGNASSGHFRMSFCCTLPMFTVGCVQQKFQGNLTLTILTWDSKQRLTKPCAPFWLTGWSTYTKNGNCSLRLFS